ncbi:hypothetical protein IV203_012556 [Nitzschia inconspicua]|uniref:Uncharacterized protein n=1 Tax=Nitzschia inconspicua TaxID=303405 RepID=A0A9K3KV76_9STRA|nr:hypothetical protein IV203_012556 [Nitzschia inconspicua]
MVSSNHLKSSGKEAKSRSESNNQNGNEPRPDARNAKKGIDLAEGKIPSLERLMSLFLFKKKKSKRNQTGRRHLLPHRRIHPEDKSAADRRCAEDERGQGKVAHKEAQDSEDNRVSPNGTRINPSSSTVSSPTMSVQLPPNTRLTCQTEALQWLDSHGGHYEMFTDPNLDQIIKRLLDTKLSLSSGQATSGFGLSLGT